MKTYIKDITIANKNYILFSNNNIELTIAKDFGPRITGLNLKGGINLFGEVNVNRKTPYGIWNLYGGHRLWIAPESFPKTYIPDNKPVSIKKRGDRLTIKQEVLELKITKSIIIKFINKNSIEVIHKIKNNNKKNIEFSVWALSLMRKGGFAILPQNRKKADKDGYLPNRTIILWPYSDITDNRLKLGNKYIFIKQGGEKPFKIGQRITDNSAAYYYKGYLFTKKFQFIPKKNYPDFNCNVEIYSCKEFLELETLSPLHITKPGQTITHKEIWNLKKEVAIKFGETFQ